MSVSLGAIGVAPGIIRILPIVFTRLEEVLRAHTAATAESLILGLRLDTGVPIAAAHEPPLDDVFGWALAAGLLAVTPKDRVVLTTRGRLLSNELFSRLV